MRHTAERLAGRGQDRRRITLDDDLTFKAGLEKLLKKHRVTELTWMSDPNRPVDERIARICQAHDVETDVLSDGLFLTPEDDVDAWFSEHQTPLMEDFYHWQRRRTGILMDGGKPAGRRWNFDADNRKALPKKGIEIPPLPQLEHDEITRTVIAEVDERYPEHPGSAADFWLPVTPADSRDWLDVFVAERLHDFGRYEDAMKADEPFLFHAIISPMLNIGLLTVEEVVAAATRTDAPWHPSRGSSVRSSGGASTCAACTGRTRSSSTSTRCTSRRGSRSTGTRVSGCRVTCRSPCARCSSACTSGATRTTSSA